MSNLETLKQIAPRAIDNKGKLKPFDKQVDDYLWGNLKPRDLLVVSESSDQLGIPPKSDLPLVIDQTTIEKIKSKYDVDISDIKKLPDLFRTSPLAYDSFSQNNSVVVIFDLKDRHDNIVIAPIHLDKQLGRFVVDEIASVYGKKKIENTLNKSFEQHHIYTNERTSAWLKLAGLQLPGKSNQAQSQFIPMQTKKQVVPPKSPAITQRPKINTTEGESGLDPLIEQSLYNSDEMNQELGL